MHPNLQNVPVNALGVSVQDRYIHEQITEVRNELAFVLEDRRISFSSSFLALQGTIKRVACVRLAPYTNLAHTVICFLWPRASGSASMVQVSVREAFTAPPGRVLVAADYRQIEARVLAHFSQVLAG